MRASGVLAWVSSAVLLTACGPARDAPEALVPGLSAALPALEHVRVEQGDTPLEFERHGDAWRVRDAAWRVDRRWLQPLLIGLANARCDEARTADPRRFARIGVDWPPAPPAQDADGAFARPTARVSFDLKGREVGVIVGFPQARGGTFARVEGAAHSCLTAASLRVPARPAAWFDPRLWEWPPERIAAISVEDAGVAPLRLVQRDARFVVEGQVLALTPMPDALAAALAAPRHEDRRSRVPDAAGVAPARVLRLVLDSGETFALALRREGEQSWAWAVEVPEAEREAFAAREFLLPPDVADPLWTSRESLGAP